MARIALAPELTGDFDCVIDHLETHGVTEVSERIGGIIAAIDVLELNPLIGRPAGAERRELVIGRRSRGYIALYRYVEAIDTVFVLALRAQKEAGYAHD
ncbi:MAG TPA: type II toxin-antitoxin system RelE/ParE family toxin [Burkholderiales bacterium]